MTSTKEIALCVPTSDKLGQEVPCKTGGPKAAVMLWLNRGKAHPKYNRMSGITPWKNAICLCINVGGDKYENIFLEGGCEMSWFASSTQHEATPVIARLLYQSERSPKAKTAVQGSKVKEEPSENEGRDDVVGVRSEQLERRREGKDGLGGTGKRCRATPSLVGDGPDHVTQASKRMRPHLSTALKPRDVSVKQEELGDSERVQVHLVKQEITAVEEKKAFLQGLSRRHRAVLLRTLIQKEAESEQSASVKQERVAVKTESVKCEDVYSDLLSPITVLLFCRLPKQPYVYCGELRYVEHAATSRPMRVIWELKDFHTLVKCPLFQRILKFPNEPV
eukprot:gb/GEZN01006109.1/.p1 GENE.gb/GEZN01006109.1/~~gb/GEZN01006109.1/.p1  ORF type:complete len:335 (-),score=66.59 gb/GEZN01006109.1/:170-1174(-)